MSSFLRNKKPEREGGVGSLLWEGSLGWARYFRDLTTVTNFDVTFGGSLLSGARYFRKFTVRVLGSKPHIPTQFFLEYPPGIWCRAKLSFLWVSRCSDVFLVFSITATAQAAGQCLSVLGFPGNWEEVCLKISFKLSFIWLFGLARLLC